jgi:hypothetical protein
MLHYLVKYARALTFENFGTGRRGTRAVEQEEARSRSAHHADSSLIPCSLSQAPSLGGAQQQHLTPRLN